MYKIILTIILQDTCSDLLYPIRVYVGDSEVNLSISTMKRFILSCTVKLEEEWFLLLCYNHSFISTLDGVTLSGTPRYSISSLTGKPLYLLNQMMLGIADMTLDLIEIE